VVFNLEIIRSFARDEDRCLPPYWRR